MLDEPAHPGDITRTPATIAADHSGNVIAWPDGGTSVRIRLDCAENGVASCKEEHRAIRPTPPGHPCEQRRILGLIGTRPDLVWKGSCQGAWPCDVWVMSNIPTKTVAVVHQDGPNLRISFDDQTTTEIALDPESSGVLVRSANGRPSSTPLNCAGKAMLHRVKKISTRRFFAPMDTRKARTKSGPSCEPIVVEPQSANA
jgi:hypothetical protein